MAERKRFTRGKLYENGEGRRIVMKDDGKTVTWMHPISLVEEKTPHVEFKAWFDKGGSSKPVKRHG